MTQELAFSCGRYQIIKVSDKSEAFHKGQEFFCREKIIGLKRFEYVKNPYQVKTKEYNAFKEGWDFQKNNLASHLIVCK